MNKTDNYQLNQWEKTDRILMEDFNRDNAEIDAAIAANAAGLAAEETARLAGDAALAASITATNPIVRLRDVTTSAAANQVNLPLNGIDWEAYGDVLLYCRLKLAPPSPNTSYNMGYVTVRVNNSSASGGYFLNSNYADRLNTLTVQVTGTNVGCRIPIGKTGFAVLWDFTGDNTSLSTPSRVVSNNARSSFSTMNFICEQPLDAGCKFTILGVKL